MPKTEPMDEFKNVSQDLLKVLGQKAIGKVSDRVGGLTDKFEDIAGGGPIGKAVAEGGEAAAKGDSPVGGVVKGAFSGIKDKVTGGGKSGGGGSKPTKATKIIEQIDVGVPLSVAYNQWTEFGEFPSFMRKVENAEAKDETKIEFKARIFWSHRSWDATILEQIPDKRIVWRSKGDKGHVDGGVTFHELDSELTRILVVLEYYPQGLMERTGNIWRAQGRRVRAELRQFQRHVMTRTILAPDDVEGWRGIIRDSEVVKDHDEVVEEEEREAQEQEDDENEDESEPDDEGYDDEDEPDDEGYDDEDESDQPEDAEEEEYDDEPEEEDEEEDEPYDKPARRSRRRR